MANSEQSLDKIVEKAGESQMRFGEDLEEANLNVDQADYSKSKAALISDFKQYQPKID